MKKILFALFIVGCTLPLSVKASHMAGAEIWYEYTGDSANPQKYRVWLQFYRDVSGIQAPSNPTLCISNTCSLSNPSSQFTFKPFVLKNTCPSGDTCYGSVPGSIKMLYQTYCIFYPASREIYRFYADVTLTGNCTEWKFAFTEQARNANDNLSTFGRLYTEAVLNNTLGPKSSAHFVAPAIRNFCTNQPVVWHHEAVDSSDSIYYELATPLTGDCNSPSQASYVNGYTYQQPITTQNGVILNHRTGSLFFTPTQQEVVVVKIVAKSYTINPSLGWLLTSQATRDVMISIYGNCQPESWSLEKPDSLTRVVCGDTALILKTGRIFESASLSQDGSEFRVTSSSGAPLPVIKAMPVNALPTGEARELRLSLFQALSTNDTLSVELKAGNDGNSLISICGEEANAFDSLLFYVKGCSGVGLSEKRSLEFSIYPNPAQSEITLSFADISSQREISILNSSGQIVRTVSSGFIEKRIDISNLPAGLYFIESRETSARSSQKFIKLK